MIKLLKYWHFGAITFLLLVIVLQYFRDDSRLQTCQANAADIQAQLVAFKATAWAEEAKLQKELRLKEQEAAKAQAESKVRMDEIMELDLSKMNCEQLTEWKIKKMEFIWHNNIP
jgi:hypothetical protein